MIEIEFNKDYYCDTPINPRVIRTSFGGFVGRAKSLNECKCKKINRNDIVEFTFYDFYNKKTYDSLVLFFDTFYFKKEVRFYIDDFFVEPKKCLNYQVDYRNRTIVAEFVD